MCRNYFLAAKLKEEKHGSEMAVLKGGKILGFVQRTILCACFHKAIPTKHFDQETAHFWKMITVRV